VTSAPDLEPDEFLLRLDQLWWRDPQIWRDYVEEMIERSRCNGELEWQEFFAEIREEGEQRGVMCHPRARKKVR
jgi:hypothetical protein